MQLHKVREEGAVDQCMREGLAVDHTDDLSPADSAVAYKWLCSHGLKNCDAAPLCRRVSRSAAAAAA